MAAFSTTFINHIQFLETINHVLNLIFITYKNKPEKIAFSVQLKTVFYKRQSRKGFFASKTTIDKLVCVM